MSKKKQGKAPVLRFKGFTDDWEQRKLGDIANVYDGTHTTPDYQKNGIMFLSVENIDTLTSKKFITKSDYLENYKHKPEYHDIFMTRIGSIGKTNILETHDPRAFYVSLALIKPKDIDPYYLKYWLSSNTTQKEIWRRTLQIAFPQKINKDEISKVQSSISKSKNEQYNIGKLLNKIDHLLLLQQRKLDRLKEIRKSYLSKIFPNKRENRPSLKFNNLKNTSWKPHKLKDIVTNVETGKSKVKLQPKGKYPVLGSTSIIGYNDHYDYSGDFILIARVGAYAGKMYRFSGSVKITDNTVFIQSAYNTFLYYYLRNFNLKKLSFGSGQPLVKSSELKSLSILIPSSKEEIKAISRLSIIFDNLINVQEKKVSSIRQIKKFLLQNMFT